MYNIHSKKKVPNGTPISFNKSNYHFWYKELMNNFLPVMIDTTHNNVHFKNQIIGRFPGML